MLKNHNLKLYNDFHYKALFIHVINIIISDFIF